MMKKVILFTLLFLFLSPVLWAKRQVYVGEITDLHPLLMEGRPFTLSSPAGSYQKIFEVRNSFQSYNCLFYKIPLNDSTTGELFEFESPKPCHLRALKEQKPTEGEVLEMRLFDIDFETKMTFKVHLKTKKEEKRLTYFLPFLSRHQSYWPGLFPIFSKDNTQAKPSFIKFEKGNVCHQGCGELKGECERCPQSQWTAILNLKCGSQITGICGSSLCGGRGQHACVRMTALEQNLSCEEMKEFVYCSYGYEVECQSNGEVTCR